MFSAALCQLSVPTAADAQLENTPGEIHGAGANWEHWEHWCEGSSEPPLIPQEHEGSWEPRAAFITS